MPLDVNWPFPPHGKASRWYMVKNRTVVTLVGTISKLLSECLNSATVYNQKVLYDAIEHRSDDQPLITVCNHSSCIDDPIIWGTLKFRHMINMRWTPTASDICFTKEWHSKFFSLGQCVPVVRGEGVYQNSMDFLVEKLNAGAWVHVFPEGRVNELNEFIRLKWGVGRLIMDCTKLPIILPLWHIGMEDILKNKRPYIPRFGKKLTMLIGQPIDVEDLLNQLREAKKSPREIRKALTDKIQEEFYALKSKTEKLHFGTVDASWPQ